jgi:hypothetical protein
VEHWNKTYPNLCLKQPTISAWLTNKTKYHQEYAKIQAWGLPRNTKHIKQTEHLEVNEMLELWVSKAMSDGIQLSGEILRQKWNCFADLARVPNDK